MTRPTVYLAGPIMGCAKDEANDWRRDVAAALAEHGILGISPLRCEPIIGETYAGTYSDPLFGTSRAIANKNLLDVRKCDMIFAYLPPPPEGRNQSWGTIMEIGWAHMLDKSCILVSRDPQVLAHPLINACSGWILPTLHDGIEVAIGMLAAYAGGKNV